MIFINRLKIIIISILLSILVAAIANSVSIEMDSQNGKQGEWITVKILVKNTSNLAGASFGLRSDMEIKVINSPFATNAVYNPERGKLNFAGASGKPVNNTEILEFEVKGNKPKKYIINLVPLEQRYGDGYQDVLFGIDNESILVLLSSKELSEMGIKTTISLDCPDIVIEYFKANPQVIKKESLVSLSWKVTGGVNNISITAEGVYGVAGDLNKEGSIDIKMNETTEYILTALNICDKKEASVKVKKFDPPTPNIKANGSNELITITPSENLSILIELSSGSLTGDDADWWLLANTPFGWYHYNLLNNSWTSNFDITHQGPLFNLGEFNVLNASLPAGAYKFYFGVDNIMNGSLDINRIYYDAVKVNIIK